MHIKVSREIVSNVVKATIQILGFDAQEAKAILRYGYPMIDVGGSFSDTFTRTTEVATTLAVLGDGAGAVLTPVINPETGVIESVTVEDGGAGYTTASVVVTSGLGGSGAVLTAVRNTGTIESVTVDNGGTGYLSAPMTVAFTLPDSSKLLTETFTYTQNFSYTASRNADLQAKLFTNVLETRIETAVAALTAKQAEYLGETDKTL